MRRHGLLLPAAVGAFLLLAAACGSSAQLSGRGGPHRPVEGSQAPAQGGPAAGDAASPGSADAAGGNPTRLPPGEVVVSAAASLTEAFGRLAGRFEEAHPGVAVRLNVAGSQQLAAQILDGAPVGVFASADQRQMRRVTDAGLHLARPRVLSHNRLAVAVEPGNPRGITGLSDLAHPDLTVVLAAEEVPAGRYTLQLLRRAGVEVRPDSLETDVRVVLAKVALGEADAGVVYRSDIVAAGERVEEVPISYPEVTATYAVAPLRLTPRPDLAQAFVDLALSRHGREALRRAGLSPP